MWSRIVYAVVVAYRGWKDAMRASEQDISETDADSVATVKEWERNRHLVSDGTAYTGPN